LVLGERLHQEDWENGTNDAPVGDELMMQGGESMKQ
jgi:hypothetical protein